MERPVRIGLAGVEDRRLLAELRALPGRPEVHTFGAIYDDTEAIVALRPDLLFLPAPTGPQDGADLAGALRLLRRLLGTLELVALAPASREVELARFCERSGARLLLQPYTPAALGSLVAQALTGSDRPRDEVFLDLARGFADEVNNPLLFLMGHLQLLHAQLDPEAGRDQRDQVDSALKGAQQIQATVDRIRLLARAATGPRRTEGVDLHDLLREALRPLPKPAPALLREPDDADCSAPADPELLRPAIDVLARVAAELHAIGCQVHFQLARLDGALRLRMALRGPGLEDWRLPRTFEPYYLNRLLRGSSQGLSLFVVQTAIHAHGGQATARRLPDGSLAVDLLLPLQPLPAG